MASLTTARVATIGKQIATAAAIGVAMPDDELRRDREYLAASTWRYAVTIDRLERASRRPLPQARIIDVGAYPGHLAAYLSQAHGAQVTAVTLMTSDAFETRMRGAGVTVARHDVEREALPADAGTADVVLCCELIEHLDGDVRHMLREARRVVHGDGALLLTTPNHASIEHRWALLRGRSVYPPLDLPDYPFYAGAGTRNPMRHVREFTVAEIAGLLREAGFTRVTISTVSPPLNRAAQLSWRGRVGTRLQHLAQRWTADGGALIVAWAQP
jgi:2-polyprenyl-3-methyl-5-hydroxy-6-metoxy-1,4-benzoquinol methylase